MVLLIFSLATVTKKPDIDGNNLEKLYVHYNSILFEYIFVVYIIDYC